MSDGAIDTGDVAPEVAGIQDVSAEVTDAGASIDQSELDAALDATFPDGKDLVGQTEVSGFDESGLTTNEDVVDYLDTNIPPEHLQDIDAIKYVDDRQEYAQGILGRWRSDPVEGISVSVYPHDDAGEMFDTIAHEVGHNAEDKLVASEPDLVDQWQLIYDQSAAALNQSGGEQNEFVTPYAETSADEDFAESYAMYVNDPEYLQAVSSQKFDFMDLFVFGR